MTLATAPPCTVASEKEKRIKHWLPAAYRLANRFAHRGEPIEDLRQVAALALVKAVNRYDPDKGTEFASYAIPTIVGELKRYFRDCGWDVRVTRQLQERSLDINQAATHLTQRLHHAPTITDLASYLNLTHEEIREGIKAGRAYSATSLSALASVGDDIKVVETHGADDPGFAHTDNLLSLQPALARLDSRVQRIIAYRFYGNMSQSRIAAHLGTSQMYISRLIKDALTQLRQHLRDTRPTRQ